MSRKHRIPITKDIISQLEREKERTQIGPVALMSKKWRTAPKGVTSSNISAWMSGKTKTALPGNLQYVLDLWKSLPDAKPGTGRLGRKSWVNTEDCLRLSHATIELLNSYRDKSYLPSKLFKYFSDPPGGLRPKTITSWLDAGVIHAHKEHIKYVLDKCAALDERPDRPVVISEATKLQLEEYKDQTGFGATRLSKLKDVYPPPKGFSFGVVAGWLNGTIRTTQQNYIEYIFMLYEEVIQKNITLI